MKLVEEGGQNLVVVDKINVGYIILGPCIRPIKLYRDIIIWYAQILTPKILFPLYNEVQSLLHLFYEQAGLETFQHSITSPPSKIATG